MKLLGFLFFFPSLAWSVAVPLNTFEQAKLETLLRNIPSYLVKTEKREGFVRKYHLFPKSKKSSFTINCYADYYGAAPIPSEKFCEVEVLDKNLVGDEYVIQLNDSSIVATLRNAISYGADVKKFISLERVWGHTKQAL